MRPWRSNLGRLAAGSVLLGLLQGFSSISYNEILFEFLVRWLSILVAVLFGGDLSAFNSGSGNGLEL